MKGRKPQSAAVKDLKNVREDRINRNAPMIVGNFPACPSFLGKEGRKEWFRIRKEVRACPYITTLDRAVLAGYCTHWEMFLSAQAIVIQTGPYIKTTKGNVIQNPALSGMNKHLEQVLKFGAALGFTPTERSRLSVPKKRKKKNDFEEMLD